jgi:organic radical activating enzyme
MEAVKPVNMEQLSKYKSVMISGGEPLLYPKKLKALIHQLRKNNPEQIISLYTTLASDALIDMLWMFDRIHYTLHAPHTAQDQERFIKFQDAITNPHYSYRLYIDPAIKDVAIPIIPNRWNRVEVKPWIDEGDCPVPDGEDLVELRGAGFNAVYSDYLISKENINVA